jgi:Zn-dependent alcohol dehydrogenase
VHRFRFSHGRSIQKLTIGTDARSFYVQHAGLRCEHTTRLHIYYAGECVSVVVGVWTVQGWGKTVVLGVDGSAAPISVPSLDIMRGRSVTGSLFGGIKPPCWRTSTWTR